MSTIQTQPLPYCDNYKYTISFLPHAGLLGSLFSFLQFFASPLIGASSDILGRKPVLVSTMVSNIIIIMELSGHNKR